MSKNKQNKPAQQVDVQNPDSRLDDMASQIIGLEQKLEHLGELFHDANKPTECVSEDGPSEDLAGEIAQVRGLLMALAEYTGQSPLMIRLGADVKDLHRPDLKSKMSR